MSDRCWRHRPALGVVLDVAVDPVDRSGEAAAQQGRAGQSNPGEGLRGQRKEIEDGVGAVEWVIRAIGPVIEEPQEDGPVLDLSPGNKHSEEAGTGGGD